MDLSIIIVSWNTRDLLAQCLESLITAHRSPITDDLPLPTAHRSPITDDLPLTPAHRPLTTELFVVDNASSDDSAAMVRQRFLQVHLIQNSENVGFARANNQAIQASAGRYVLLLNSDTIVQPRSLENMVAFMEGHPNAGIVGANILNPDRTPQYCFGKFPTLVSELSFAWGMNTHYPFSMGFAPQLGFSENWIQTDWVVGAGLVIRREVLDKVGLLDESYFMYSEEIDLARRVAQAGWQTYVLRDAPIVHLGQQSSKQIPAAMKAQLFRSKVLYFRKHHGRVAASFLRAFFGLSMLIKYGVYSLLRQTELARLWRATWRHFVTQSPLTD